MKLVEHVSLDWSEGKPAGKGILHRFTTPADTSIFLNTYFAEGPSSDKLRIVDLKGRTYELLFAEQGMGSPSD